MKFKYIYIGYFLSATSTAAPAHPSMPSTNQDPMAAVESAEQSGGNSAPLQQPGSAADQGALQDEAGQDGELVVTGSRLVTDGTRAPTPVTVVSADSLAATAPGAIAEGLNQLPIFQGSINSQMTQVHSSTRVRSGNYLNLRNLGPQRVLVLQDGYRLPPSGNNGGVDTNIIPQMLVERVDVVTGGASAVYGSDAVSGVVNYVIDKKFTGVKALAQTGISTFGDAFSYRLGMAAGTKLADDRLTLQASAEYYSHDGIPRRDTRRVDENWATGARDPSQQSGPLGSAENPLLDYPDVRTTTMSWGGLITGGPAALRNLEFLPSGALGPFNMGTPIGRPGYGQGADGPICHDCTLMPSSTTSQIFGRATYDFGSNVEGFIQASYNTATNYGENARNALRPGVTIYSDNYFLQRQLTPSQLEALGTGTLTVAREFADWETRAKAAGAAARSQDLDSLVVMGGLAGDLFGDWRWDTAFTYGVTDFKNVIEEPRSDRFAAAIDVVDDGNGNPICRVTLISGRFPDCKPLNILGEGRADPAAVQWVLDDSRWGVKNYLYFGGLNFAGSLFSTWAGPVTLAVGAEYRKQKVRQTSNSDPATPTDYTGIRGNQRGTFLGTNVGVADGSYTVKEAYAEIVVPLVKDASFTNSLELNAAFRHADYSTSGGVNTYKVGATWEPISDIRFRGAFSRDIRAPSLFELFAGQTLVSPTVYDPITNATHIVTDRGGGNPNLKPEKANTLTLGAVLQPSFLPGFYGSIDYYKIKIEDAIGTPGSVVEIFNRCGANRDSPICDLIIRDANNNPIEVFAVNNNVAVLSSKGVDFEFGYRTPVGDGDLSLRAMGTRLISYKRQDTPAVPIVEYVGTAELPGFLASTYPLPKWRANLDVGFENDSFSLGVRQRMIGSYVKGKNIQHWVHNKVPVVFYTDLNIAKKFSVFEGESELFLTVNNLFNKKGPFFVTDQNMNQPPTPRAIYDIVGRYFTFGVRARF